MIRVIYCDDLHCPSCLTKMEVGAHGWNPVVMGEKTATICKGCDNIVDVVKLGHDCPDSKLYKFLATTTVEE